jgi:hypothetical protein
LELAVKEKLTDRKDKLENLLKIIQDLTTPPELKTVDLLLAAVDNEGELDKHLEEMGDKINSRLIDYLTSIISNFEEQIIAADGENRAETEDTLTRLKTIYNAVLRRSMKIKFSKN